MSEDNSEQAAKPAVNTAPIKWAQRSDCLYLTVDLHGVRDEDVTFTDTEMHFRGNSEGHYFEAHLEFYKPIIPDKSKWKTHPLGVEIYVQKKQDDESEQGKKEGKKSSFWPHLLKDKSLEKLNTVRSLCSALALIVLYVNTAFDRLFCLTFFSDNCNTMRTKRLRSIGIIM